MRTLGHGLMLVCLAASGCGEFKRLAGIESSTKKTEKTTGELNENTKDMKDSIDHVDGNTRTMKDQLDKTKQEVADANKRLDEANASLDAANKGLEETNTQLEDTKKKLDDLTAVMGRSNAGIDVLVDNAGNTYVDIRQGDALAARSRQLAALEAADVLEAKIAEAWKYFAAFEFQMWKGSGADTPERRVELFAEALDEFLRDVERYLPAERARDASPLSDSSDARNLYALSTALEAYNSLQRVAVDEAPGTVTKSMLDLLHEGLAAGEELRRGRRARSSLAAWERIVLEKEDAARYLLRVRMNFLPAVPLAQVTEVERGGVTKLLELLRLGFTRWTADISGLGNVRIETMAMWIEKAEVERLFLRGVRVPVIYDPKVRQAYGNMRVVDGSEGDAGYLADRAAVRERFEAGVRAIVGGR